MKKILLLLILIGISNLLANVNTRLVQISNSGGVLVFDVEAMSDAGNVLISSFQNTLKLDNNLQGQSPSISFSNQLFSDADYNTSENYNVIATGVIQFLYTHDGGTEETITTSWIPIVRITINYTEAGVTANVTWHDGVPNYYVTDENDVVITGTEGDALNNVPLPVELSSFSVNSVEGAKTQLQWETATEVNNYGFDIERTNVVSSDVSSKIDIDTEKDWKKVAFIKGHGNSNSPKYYSFTDKNIDGGSKFLYRLKQIDIDGTFEYSEVIEIEVLPSKYELRQNYPNPFNPSTVIKFSLPEDTKLAINIYNLLGEKVITLLDKELKSGFHQVQFNTNSAGYNFASGVYIYTLESKNFTQVKKMILLK